MSGSAWGIFALALRRSTLLRRRRLWPTRIACRINGRVRMTCRRPGGCAGCLGRRMAHRNRLDATLLSWLSQSIELAPLAVEHFQMKADPAYREAELFARRHTQAIDSLAGQAGRFGSLGRLGRLSLWRRLGCRFLADGRRLFCRAWCGDFFQSVRRNPNHLPYHIRRYLHQRSTGGADKVLAGAHDHLGLRRGRRLAARFRWIVG